MSKSTNHKAFYDGYVVNEIMDACYKSAKTKKWEPVELVDWRGQEGISSNVDLILFFKTEIYYFRSFL